MTARSHSHDCLLTPLECIKRKRHSDLCNGNAFKQHRKLSYTCTDLEDLISSIKRAKASVSAQRVDKLTEEPPARCSSSMCDECAHCDGLAINN